MVHPVAATASHGSHRRRLATSWIIPIVDRTTAETVRRWAVIVGPRCPYYRYLHATLTENNWLNVYRWVSWLEMSSMTYSWVENVTYISHTYHTPHRHIWHDTEAQAAPITTSHPGQYRHSVVNIPAIHLRCHVWCRAHCIVPTGESERWCDVLYEAGARRLGTHK